MTAPKQPDKASRALDMFVAGATVRQIADRLAMTATAVEKAIRGGMATSSLQRGRLADEAPTLFLERTDALFRAHFPQALRGDHRSAEICRRILETPAPTGTSTAIAASEDETAALNALRDRLAAEIDVCKSARVLAALSRQFVAVVTYLAEVNPQPSTSKVDEIAERRAKRRQTATGRRSQASNS